MRGWEGGWEGGWGGRTEELDDIEGEAQPEQTTELTADLQKRQNCRRFLGFLMTSLLVFKGRVGSALFVFFSRRRM